MKMEPLEDALFPGLNLVVRQAVVADDGLLIDANGCGPPGACPQCQQPVARVHGSRAGGGVGLLAVLDSGQAASQLEIARLMRVAPSLVVSLADRLDAMGPSSGSATRPTDAARF
ncbi:MULTISPECIES: hypothetical protein [unclassified Streptomyces]|uniref:hypothetical protein n=1 Tax=unclassified Streptomyces TaxID=2593676 RepID=UPI0036E0BA4B